jgi:hypothetical protein
MKFAKDLHRSASLDQVTKMEQYAKKLTRGKDMGTAFVSEGFYGYDAIALIPNSQTFKKYEGYVVYDIDNNKPMFVQEEKED